MADAPRTPTTTVTSERGSQIVLIGINRPEVHNRVDPETYSGLGKALFVREAGWANAMRYMLTGDHWGAEEAWRMGIVQQVVLTPADALQAGIEIAQRIAACGPLGIRATLASAHVALKSAQGEAFAKLDAEYRGLYATEDFKEGRRAEAEGRTPVYHGR
jgi:enoyl-CoA hydratase